MAVGQPGSVGRAGPGANQKSGKKTGPRHTHTVGKQMFSFAAGETRCSREIFAPLLPSLRFASFPLSKL